MSVHAIEIYEMIIADAKSNMEKLAEDLKCVLDSSFVDQLDEDEQNSLFEVICYLEAAREEMDNL